MAVGGRVAVLNEVTLDQDEGAKLHLQRVRYMYDDGSTEDGFRFIWRRADGSLQGARGQARLPDLQHAKELIREAERQGWGRYTLGDDGRFIER
jgi:hypothetical protein